MGDQFWDRLNQSNIRTIMLIIVIVGSSLITTNLGNTNPKNPVTATVNNDDLGLIVQGVLGESNIDGKVSNILRPMSVSDLGLKSNMQAHAVYQYPSSIIMPNTATIVTSPGNQTVEFNSTGNQMDWFVDVTTGQSKFYNISRNGSQVQDGTWSGNIDTTISQNLDGLEMGIHNFTLVVREKTFTDPIEDMDTVWVTVINSPPRFENPSETYTYEYGVQNNYLTWNVTEYTPKNYTIYENDSEVFSEPSLQNQGIIQYSIDNLGSEFIQTDYNYTIVVFDILNQSNSSTTNVTVLPSENPIWDTQPTDINFNESGVAPLLIWNATDQSPYNYTIYNNGSFVESGLWNNTDNRIRFVEQYRQYFS
jgi:hypothetical protein